MKTMLIIQGCSVSYQYNSDEAGVVQGFWEWIQHFQMTPNDPRDTAYDQMMIMNLVMNEKLWRRMFGEWCSEWRHCLLKSLLCMTESCCPDHLPACGIRNSLICFVCLHMWLLLYILNCLYLISDAFIKPDFLLWWEGLNFFTPVSVLRLKVPRDIRRAISSEKTKTKLLTSVFPRSADPLSYGGSLSSFFD